MHQKRTNINTPIAKLRPVPINTIAPQRNYHGLLDLYRAEQVSDAVKTQAEHEFTWRPLQEIASMDFDRAGSAPYIAQQLLDDTIKPRMTWFADTKPNL